MDAFACDLIDALGGTTRTAQLMNAPVSTVHNMRTKKLTGSRLDHLRRIAQDIVPPVDVDALAQRHGVELRPIATVAEPSCGNRDEVSTEASA